MSSGTATRSGPRVVLSHGNGFASDSYFPFWRHMLERFDLALFDFRNCGRNPSHAAEPHNYPRFARDNVAVHHAIAEAWGGKTTVGVFHSMSAIAALLAVIEGIWHWDALVLFDPPVMPPAGHPLRAPLLADGEILREAARIRQLRFSDPAELAEVFRTLHRFRRMRSGVAELNARSTLRFVPADGVWELCCPGPVEADLYIEGRNPCPSGRKLARPRDRCWSWARTRNRLGRRQPRGVARNSANFTASNTPLCPTPPTSCRSKNRSNASPCSMASSRSTE